MRHLIIKLLAITALTMVAACGEQEPPSPEESCHFLQNTYGQRVSWHQGPVKFYADSTMSDENVESLKEAMDIWNETLSEQRGGADIFSFGGKLPGQRGLAEDGLNVVSKLSTWARIKPTDQAITIRHWLGGTTALSETDIALNSVKPFSLASVVETGQIDSVALFVHELGHALGLDHIETDEYTVMATHLQRGDDERRKPGAIEIDALKCEY